MNSNTPAPPCEGPFHAGLQYRSGRRIYIGREPEAGEFYPQEQIHHAFKFPSQDDAASAIATIVRYFRIVNPDAIKPVIHPCARVTRRTSP